MLAVGLATRLVPTLERDAAGFVEALRGRGVQVDGIRGRARLLSPVLAGSLERALASPSRWRRAASGGRGERARPAAWTRLDRLALGAAVLLCVGAVWL